MPPPTLPHPARSCSAARNGVAAAITYSRLQIGKLLSERPRCKDQQDRADEKNNHQCHWGRRTGQLLITFAVARRSRRIELSQRCRSCLRRLPPWQRRHNSNSRVPPHCPNRNKTSDKRKTTTMTTTTTSLLSVPFAWKRCETRRDVENARLDFALTV